MRYKKHWMWNTRFYRIRYNILWRCYRDWPRAKSYKDKWIICEWNSFEEFKADMYESYLKHVEEYWEKRTSINRIDNDWNYCKKNCEWNTQKKQMLNTSKNHYLTYKWKTQTTIEWCEELWIPEGTVRVRIMRWFWIDDILKVWKIKKKTSIMEYYNKHKELKWENAKPYHTIYQRIKIFNMSIEEAINKD